jgi:hypothetical protein
MAKPSFLTTAAGGIRVRFQPCGWAVSAPNLEGSRSELGLWQPTQRGHKVENMGLAQHDSTTTSLDPRGANLARTRGGERPFVKNPSPANEAKGGVATPSPSRSRLEPTIRFSFPHDDSGGGASSDCRLSRRGVVVPAGDLGLRAGHGQLRTPLPRPLLRRRILRRVRSRRGHRLRRHLPLPERRRPPPLRPVPAGDAPADGFGRLR